MSVLDRFKLDGRVAIVIGASSGLGIAFAKALAEAGADVVLGARHCSRADHCRAPPGGLLGFEGGFDRTHPGSRAAVDLTPRR